MWVGDHCTSPRTQTVRHSTVLDSCRDVASASVHPNSMCLSLAAYRLAKVTQRATALLQTMQGDLVDMAQLLACTLTLAPCTVVLHSTLNVLQAAGSTAAQIQYHSTYLHKTAHVHSPAGRATPPLC
jgi:hypothetical protein